MSNNAYLRHLATNDHAYCWACNDFCRVAYNSHRDDLPTCATCDGEEIDDYASCLLCGGDIYRDDHSTQRDGHLAHDRCIAGNTPLYPQVRRHART